LARKFIPVCGTPPAGVTPAVCVFFHIITAIGSYISKGAEGSYHYQYPTTPRPLSRCYIPLPQKLIYAVAGKRSFAERKKANIIKFTKLLSAIFIMDGET